MKFLEAKALTNAQRGKTENKMKPGTRVDQAPPPPARQHKPEIVKLAEELDVDLDQVVGTGANGAVLAKDVRKVAQSQTYDS